MIDQETQALYDILLEAGMNEEQLKEGLEEKTVPEKVSGISCWITVSATKPIS